MIHGKKRKWLESAIAALLCLSIALIVFGYEQNRRVQALTLQVNAAYQKAFYEAMELLAGVQINLEKLLATNSPTQQQALLIAVTRQTEGAQDNLSMMPVSNEAIAGALKFINQMGDYCNVLDKMLAEGGRLTEDDIAQISILHAHCAQLNVQLYDILSQYERGELVFSAEDVTSGTVTLQEPTEPAVDYPVLLYDGPFSDASNTTEMKALGTREVTREEAEEKLRDYVGAYRIVRIVYTGESSIPVNCYEFTVETQDGILDAGVTKPGGEVLFLLSETGETEVLLSQAECIDLAAKFLVRNGYGDMRVSYWRQLEGLLTVNFAAVQDGVVLYPDLVKVQISMRTGQVVGIEAGNYLRNHVPRVFPEINISYEDALRRISDVLSVSRTQLCLIPLGNDEVLCWEASAYRDNGDQYLIYIDAVTGQESLILRVTQDVDGYVTQ